MCVRKNQILTFLVWPDFYNLKLLLLCTAEKRVGKTPQITNDILILIIVLDMDYTWYKKYGLNLNSKLGYIIGCLRFGHLLKAMKHGYKILFQKQGKYILPADFLIDEEGKIVNTYYAKDIGDHIPFETIDQFVNS